MGKSKAAFTGITLALLLLVLMFQGGEDTPPMPQCSDGIDNDSDGGIDSTDYECYFLPANDPNSSEPPGNQYCANWDDESQQPTNQQECDGI